MLPVAGENKIGTGGGEFFFIFVLPQNLRVADGQDSIELVGGDEASRDDKL